MKGTSTPLWLPPFWIKSVVKKGSTKEEIHLDVYLKLGQRYEAVYAMKWAPTSIVHLKKDTAQKAVSATYGFMVRDFPH